MAEVMVESLPDWMILDAFRYALGRMTYQVGITCDWLVANWEKLPNKLQDLIAKELQEAFDCDNRARQRGDQKPYPLGHDNDCLDWGRVLTTATRGNQG